MKLKHHVYKVILVGWTDTYNHAKGTTVEVLKYIKKRYKEYMSYADHKLAYTLGTVRVVTEEEARKEFEYEMFNEELTEEEMFEKTQKFFNSIEQSGNPN